MRDVCSELEVDSISNSSSGSTSKASKPSKGPKAKAKVEEEKPQQVDSNVQTILNYVMKEFESTCLYMLSDIDKSKHLQPEAAAKLKADIKAMMNEAAIGVIANKELQEIPKFRQNRNELTKKCTAAVGAMLKYAWDRRVEMENMAVGAGAYVPVVMDRELGKRDPKRIRRLNRFIKLALQTVTTDRDYRLKFPVNNSKSLHALVARFEQSSKTLVQVANSFTDPTEQGQFINNLLRKSLDQIGYIRVRSVPFLFLIYSSFRFQCLTFICTFYSVEYTHGST